MLFTQCFEQLFVADGSGGYAVKDTNTLQAVVWHYTDSQYVWGEQAALVKAVDGYTGPAIPDSGYTRTLANGDSVTFYFTVMVPQASGQQSFFAYKLEVNREPPHEHSYSEEWKTDGSEHWHECACGDEADRGEHEGGEANCSNRRTCEICGEPYGETDPPGHTGATELRNARPATAEEAGYTGDVHCADCGAELTKGEEIPKPHVHDHGDAWVTDSEAHWHECACGDEAERSSHMYEDGKCTACEAEDPNYVPPQTDAPGSEGGEGDKEPADTDVPKTADGLKPGLWLALGSVSLGGALLTLMAGKRSRT